MDDVQALREVMEARFEAVLGRLDDREGVATQRHAENVLRLQGIDVEVRRTNGRVTRAEEQIRSLFKRSKDRTDSSHGDAGERLFWMRLRWVAWAAGGGFSGALVVLKLMGKL
jgi:hypothetical protein